MLCWLLFIPEIFGLGPKQTLARGQRCAKFYKSTENFRNIHRDETKAIKNFVNRFITTSKWDLELKNRKFWNFWNYTIQIVSSNQFFYRSLAFSVFNSFNVKSEFDIRVKNFFDYMFYFYLFSGFCVNFLTNIPILASLTSNTTNFSILLLWWLMNFACPKIFDKLYNFPPVLITLVCAKELLRFCWIHWNIRKFYIL